jgi:hypothetical protein
MITNDMTYRVINKPEISTCYTITGPPQGEELERVMQDLTDMEQTVEDEIQELYANGMFNLDDDDDYRRKGFDVPTDDLDELMLAMDTAAESKDWFESGEEIA